MFDERTPLDRIVPTGRGKGKGRAALAGLADLGLHTAGDLLRHLPRRYETFGELTDLAALREGDEVSVYAEVESAAVQALRSRTGQMLLVTVTDGSARLALTFFGAQKLRHVIKPGVRGIFSGTVSSYRGQRQLTHPRCQIVTGDLADEEAAALVGRPIPVYPAAAGIDSQSIRKVMEVLLATLSGVPEPLPADVRERLGLRGAWAAYQGVHAPQDELDHEEGLARLKFEEAFVLQVAMAQRRASAAREPATARAPVKGGVLEAFEATLPYRLTPGQIAVGAEISADLGKTSPMHRLLQGEVGSGKTLVAVRAMLAAVDGGGQTALLAPTEVLAWQHYRSITALLRGLREYEPPAGAVGVGASLPGIAGPGVQVRLLTGSLSTAARKATLLDLVSGSASIVIGTHALLGSAVEFFDLALVVVDEQHRFGVAQRDVLRDKGRSGVRKAVPHVLVMTATPIPRTVAMSVFGDLEISTLRDLPSGRAAITTHLVPTATAPSWYERIWQRVHEEVAAGRQVYVVVPRIDGSGPAGVASVVESGSASGSQGVLGGEPGPGGEPTRGVTEVLAELRSRPELSALRIEALHGQLPLEDRERVLAGFASGEVDVLVATTIIEVGIDVPKASMMVVLDAERFGVSQLHQLRGRVGRGGLPGLCLLVTGAEEGPALERLRAVAATHDGFELARVDLEQRREGDILGSAQSGRRSSLRLLRLAVDEEVIALARTEATALVGEDPTLNDYPALSAAVAELVRDDRSEYLDRN